MIDIHRHKIIIDGEPVLLMAGEVHYFRVPRDEWEQRLDLLVETGCDVVASYIPWLFHELPDGTLDLTGTSAPERDLAAWIDLCAARGLRFFARPGPFVMAELKNEGLPYRLYTEHPEIVGVGWDAVPSPTRTVDYLAPAFLAEVDRWYAAVMPILADRLQPRGGPVIGVQLDNEIGMLAWVSNAPDLTDDVLTDFRRWCGERYGDGLVSRYPAAGGDADGWADAVRSPDESWAAALRVDLGHFMRDRFGRYVDHLAATARRHGIGGVPFMINIHGTEGGDGVPFAIGVSQLAESWPGRAGFVAGSDHYLGEITGAVAADLHFVNTAMAALNGPDQPLTSLEFEAGTGDYSGGLDALNDPSSVDLKTRLCLAQGNRMINYYLLAGGINPRLDAPVGDGNDRISFTGERHGTAAPIGPHGERGLAFAATAAITHTARTHATWLAGQTEDTDDVTLGFWADAFMTEYHHPASAVMTAVVDDLRAFRGPGARKALQRSMLFGGFRFSATDLQDPGAPLPRVVALSTGRVLDAAVQQRLADHLRDGGSLLLFGRLPEVDAENRSCTLLADALGLRPAGLVGGSDHYFPSVSGSGVAAVLGETRVGWLAGIDAPDGSEPILTDIDGRVCGVITRAAGGPAAVITAEVPTSPGLVTALLGALGCTPGLRLRTSVPGVIVTSSRDEQGQGFLHLINPTGFDATVQVDLDEQSDPTGLTLLPLELPARTGAMLPLSLGLPDGSVLVSANAEVTSFGADGVGFGPSLDGHTEAWFRTDRTVTGGEVRHSDGMVGVTAPAGERLTVTFG